MTSPYAARSQRLVAQLIDALIGAAPIVLGALLSAASDTLAALFVIGGMLWWFVYYFFADGLHDGQSFAKRWLGMRVVSAENGKPCSFGQSFIRNFMLALLGPIDWIFIFGERHQRLGDMAAGTIVVQE